MERRSTAEQPLAQLAVARANVAPGRGKRDSIAQGSKLV